VKLTVKSEHRIVVGMSGGVDSSVSAWLLKQQGYQVIGLFMKNWEDDDDDEYCSSRQDWLDAASAADVIGIDLEAVNFAAQYRERVFRRVPARVLGRGARPTPIVLCNAEIKFKAFLDHALALGRRVSQTGHYARIRTQHGRPPAAARSRWHQGSKLFPASADPGTAGAHAVSRWASCARPQVRELARRIGLSNAAKRDSTGSVSSAERPFRAFLARYPADPARAHPGNRMAACWRARGLSFYTLGQRKGIGWAAPSRARGCPGSSRARISPPIRCGWSRGTTIRGCCRNRLLATSPAWVGPIPEAGRRLAVRTRYRQADAACVVHAADAHGLELSFDEPQAAVTPGQSAVLYDAEVCLAGPSSRRRAPQARRANEICPVDSAAPSR